MAGTNRFNRLTSKEWLPFQKSWFRYRDQAEFLESYFRFFTTREPCDLPVYYSGPETGMAADAASALGFSTTNNTLEAGVQFAFIDLRSDTDALTPADYPAFCKKLIAQCKEIFEKLMHRRFLTIAISNAIMEGELKPYAWDVALKIGQFFTLKDEKIAGLESDAPHHTASWYMPSGGHFYVLHFRKDELSGAHRPGLGKLRISRSQPPVPNHTGTCPPSWFILRPQRRKKNEILHPAKFPEELPAIFIKALTLPGDNVFDPMSGTGSTQLAALANQRNGYGIELSSFFADIARERCLAYLFEKSKSLVGAEQDEPAFDMVHGDASHASQYGFPMQHLIFNSPPYWDMLNMKGAENQAKRIQQGLKTNYSNDENDLGNIADYEQFLNRLIEIYLNCIDLLIPGGYVVIVVKNIKKQGRNYPFAWDLAALLSAHMTLLPESFWCQDDLSIAPYGYGNTFVSNTFHQYCLVFQKRA